MRQLFLFILTLLVGCGKVEARQTESKSLFSIWTANANGAMIDLRQGKLDQSMPFLIILPGGERCSCSVYASGSEATGNYAVSACSYSGGGSGVDPGCAGLNESGSYTKLANALMFCSSTCADYY